MPKPYISAVIPVSNEQENLTPLFERLAATMDKTGKPWEALFTNDGSRDRSLELSCSSGASRSVRRSRVCSPSAPSCSSWSGSALWGLGIIGEYIGRIYKEVRRRPRFIIRDVYEETNE